MVYKLRYVLCEHGHSRGCRIFKFYFLSTDKQMVEIHLSTCPTKLYLSENWYFFWFFENICCGYSSFLTEMLLMSTHTICVCLFVVFCCCCCCFLREIRTIYTSSYLIIWILFLAWTMKSCPHGNGEMVQVWQVAHGISIAPAIHFTLNIVPSQNWKKKNKRAKMVIYRSSEYQTCFKWSNCMDA